MATELGNSAVLGLGATPNYIQNKISIEWDPGTRNLVPSNELGEAEPTYKAGSRTGAIIRITVNKNNEDANGQVALNTAASDGSSVDFTLGPQGSSSGSEKITGTAFVETEGAQSMNHDQMTTKTYVLKVSGAYTEGTFI